MKAEPATERPKTERTPQVKEPERTDGCLPVTGLVLDAKPDDAIVPFLQRLKPKSFGIWGNAEALDWIQNLRVEELLGYRAGKFFGHRDFDFLVSLNPDDVKTIRVLGYNPYPDKEAMPIEEFTQRIQVLKDRFPEKRFLIGSTVDLFRQLDKKAEHPGFLGLELLKKHQESFREGRFDTYIQETLEHRKSLVLFVTLKDPSDLDDRLKAVLERALEKSLKIGLSVENSRQMLEPITEMLCPDPGSPRTRPPMARKGPPPASP